MVLLLHDPRQKGDERLNVAIVIPEGASDELIRERLWNAWRTYRRLRDGERY